MSLRKILGPVLAVLVLAGVAGAVYVSHTRQVESDARTAAQAAIIHLKGMIGSEKESFFNDPSVVKLLAKHGFELTVEKVGSREIASRDLAGYDFAFPAGTPAAITLQNKIKAKEVFTPFFTPMAIASWRQLIPVLEQSAVVKKGADGSWYVVDMGKLLSMSEKGLRWKDLPGNTVFPTGKTILISSTDVRKSNSGAMYLALASYVANGNNVVDNNAQLNKVLPFVTSLFVRQGLQESSSAGPFEDFTTMGMGKAPLVFIYESQFLEYQSKRAQPNADMVLLYPQPTLYTKHTLVPFNENGRRLGELLSTDAQLQKLAADYGYRTSSPDLFASFLKQKKLEAPTILTDVIDPPSYEILERMIKSIEAKFQ
ncbi:hypothetical protein [Herbaspirillum camelliae]|uniref:hypothetical protein n=1 Tax=Herbaspirillum camelliae TaxID=1892903 RepID=UPI000949D7D6|nr:hypothetical protein [Herbaspirillum camelliae]